jgi:hypothetical protein
MPLPVAACKYHLPAGARARIPMRLWRALLRNYVLYSDFSGGKTTNHTNNKCITT